MKNKLFYFIAFVCSIGINFGATQIVSGNITDSVGSTDTILSVPGFNPSLGTLNSVSYHWTADGDAHWGLAQETGGSVAYDIMGQLPFSIKAPYSGNPVIGSSTLDGGTFETVNDIVSGPTNLDASGFFLLIGFDGRI